MDDLKSYGDRFSATELDYENRHGSLSDLIIEAKKGLYYHREEVETPTGEKEEILTFRGNSEALKKVWNKVYWATVFPYLKKYPKDQQAELESEAWDVLCKSVYEAEPAPTRKGDNPKKPFYVFIPYFMQNLLGRRQRYNAEQATLRIKSGPLITAIRLIREGKEEEINIELRSDAKFMREARWWAEAKYLSLDHPGSKDLQSDNPGTLEEAIPDESQADTGFLIDAKDKLAKYVGHHDDARTTLFIAAIAGGAKFKEAVIVAGISPETASTHMKGIRSMLRDYADSTTQGEVKQPVRSPDSIKAPDEHIALFKSILRPFTKAKAKRQDYIKAVARAVGEKKAEFMLSVFETYQWITVNDKFVKLTERAPV